MDFIDRLKKFESHMSIHDGHYERHTWNSLYVDYHPPVVERLWQWWVINEVKHRVYLHRIHPCGGEAPLMHTHPWPSAIKVLAGTQEIYDGYGDRTILTAGAYYSMTDPAGLHSVNPIGGPSLSIMITGTPYEKVFPKAAIKPMRKLTVDEADSLIEDVLMLI